jgi:uncharacterized protein YodC (DUF2158 family)
MTAPMNGAQQPVPPEELIANLPNDLPTGTVVQLISGGPPMTVRDNAPYTLGDKKTFVRGYVCDWYDNENRLCSSMFLRGALIRLPALEHGGLAGIKKQEKGAALRRSR